MAFPTDILQPELDELFPLKRNGFGDGVFEIGLALAGTVSAGAYTAGVLDFLMEALDAWTKAKEGGHADAPKHKVVLSTVAGTSGGGINSALLARAAGWSFKHGSVAGNPFYTTWTTTGGLSAFLSDAPERGVSGFGSAFNCTALDKIADTAIRFTGQPLGDAQSPKFRSYLADPLRLMVMVGNVSGLPYAMKWKGETDLRHDMMAHADFVRFSLTVNGGHPNPPASRPDELPLSSGSETNWGSVQAAALATSAFPIVFRSRPVTRSLASCGYRVTVVPSDTGPAQVTQLIPRWEALAKPDDVTVDLVTVDGGTVNNEPFDVVRTALAGFNNRNTRDGKNADRAVIMVDPFSDPETVGPTKPPGAFGLILPLVMSLVYQARFKPADLALARDPDVYSRFLIAPFGPGAEQQPFSGKGAIAAGGLGGFLGFVDPGFMEYDYKLGRRNAYEFLTEEFLFPEANPVFGDPYWTDAQRDKYRKTVTINNAPIKVLPMIPLMSTVEAPPAGTALRWPQLPKFPEKLPDAIEARLDAVFDLILEEVKPKSWFKSFAVSTYLKLGWGAAKGSVRDAAVKVLTDALLAQKLLDPSSVEQPPSGVDLP